MYFHVQNSHINDLYNNNNNKKKVFKWEDGDQECSGPHFRQNPNQQAGGTGKLMIQTSAAGIYILQSETLI
jgi:hypothetical protein